MVLFGCLFDSPPQLFLHIPHKKIHLHQLHLFHQYFRDYQLDQITNHPDYHPRRKSSFLPLQQEECVGDYEESNNNSYRLCNENYRCLILFPGNKLYKMGNGKLLCRDHRPKIYKCHNNNERIFYNLHKFDLRIEQSGRPYKTFLWLDIYQCSVVQCKNYHDTNDIRKIDYNSLLSVSPYGSSGNNRMFAFRFLCNGDQSQLLSQGIVENGSSNHSPHLSRS